MKDEGPEIRTCDVSLIGAGPGDPGLITVRGLERLREADVVIYDALSDPSLLQEVSPEAILIDAGKRAKDHTLTQDEINALLVEHAEAGRFVVRLKGGDPYLFGRGGEEAIYLAERGLVCEVLPGVTSGLAAPALAGIPATFRGMSSSVTLLTGHETPEKSSTQLDYAALAGMVRSGGTLCVYMGVGRMAGIMAALVSHGVSGETPAALVQWGAMPRQRSVRGTVATLERRVSEAGLGSPAIIVIGSVAGLDEPALGWFTGRPLFGQRVLVTRTRAQASSLSSALRALGAEVVEAATIRIRPNEDRAMLDRVVSAVGSYDWLAVTSVNAVESLRVVMDRVGLDARSLAGVRVAAVGAATAGSLRERLGVRADVLPDEAHGGALATVMLEASEGSGRALLWRADIGGATLPGLLRDSGWTVEDVPAYFTEPVERLEEGVVEALAGGGVDWVTFTSSSTARNLVSCLERAGAGMGSARRVSIGPVTSRTLDELGYPADVEATEASVAGLVRAMVASASG
ncbi:uroporphyrinogen-III C-methyltransferase [Mucisphaera calidilacus]|uniref:uroporphyrinogen-III C-methyltransferase n=1 Tax=Mucisphaera calidilacus TaxID=2527982 RepID=A0A518BX65_9BACT|nr:uroporphyrinogen-III C-methyltransferase [Mucisphaera calidilacus]QDU71565.1 Uroporphyrinogen-III C-methyltransferase [Mucisphaera calidilacus]